MKRNFNIEVRTDESGGKEKGEMRKGWTKRGLR